ncbi:MAG: glutamyl-tRNA amidotransferase [Eubacterium sp.]
MTKLNKKKSHLKNRRGKKLSRILAVCLTVLFCVYFAMTAYAANGDPLAVINNLSILIFGIIRAVGMIILGWGVVQIGLSFQAHDPSQRANGFLTLAGGVVITFAKEILDLIIG